LDRFQAQGWSTSPFNLYAAKGGNMWRDLERLCADFKLSFRRPEPFPQNSLRAQTEEAQRLGIFGAPSLVPADGELFWGNDRLERALAWAKNGR
jgi:2-hydroxychromene-2-carboxylate isomerase